MSNVRAAPFDCSGARSARRALRKSVSRVAAILRSHAAAALRALRRARRDALLCDAVRARRCRGSPQPARGARFRRRATAICGACLAPSAALMRPRRGVRLCVSRRPAAAAHQIRRQHRARRLGGRSAGGCGHASACAQRRERSPATAIVALPLAAARQRERGFNQAGEIAARVARAIALPLAAPLVRVAGGVAADRAAVGGAPQQRPRRVRGARRRAGHAHRARRRRDDHRRHARRSVAARSSRRRGARRVLGGRAHAAAGSGVTTRRDVRSTPALRFRRRPRPSGDPAQHRQRDPADREHRRGPAPRRAARLPDGRSRAEARGPRLPRVRARPRASRFRRVPRGPRRASAPRRWFAFTTDGERSLYDARFAPGDVLVFGCESSGLAGRDPRAIRADARAAHPDAARRAQPQPVERRRRRRLRGVAADADSPAADTTSATLVGIFGGDRVPSRVRPAGSTSPLGSRLALEQALHRVARRKALVEHRDARRRRSASRRRWRASARTAAAAATPSATWPSPARISASDLPSRQREADAPVARQVAGAGEHEVAEPREAHQRLAPAAERGGQAARLGEAARDQRRARVVAEAEAVARAGGDRQHVLHRAADFDAGDVVALVGAQRVGAQQRGDARRERARRSRRPPAPSAGRARLPPRSSVRRRRPPAPASAAPAPDARARRRPGTRRSPAPHEALSRARRAARARRLRERRARRPASAATGVATIEQIRFRHVAEVRWHDRALPAARRPAGISR